MQFLAALPASSRAEKSALLFLTYFCNIFSVSLRGGIDKQYNTVVYSITVETEFLTVPQVAELLKINTETVYRYLRAGKLPGSKIGDVWRVGRIELDNFIRKKNNGNEQPKTSAV